MSRMNYACLDARVLSNTSAIIIETIEKTMPDGSIIRQPGGGGGGGFDPDAPPLAPATQPPGRAEGDLFRRVPVPSGSLPHHVLDVYV